LTQPGRVCQQPGLLGSNCCRHKRCDGAYPAMVSYLKLPPTPLIKGSYLSTPSPSPGSHRRILCPGRCTRRASQLPWGRACLHALPVQQQPHGAVINGEYIQAFPETSPSTCREQDVGRNRQVGAQETTKSAELRVPA